MNNVIKHQLAVAAVMEQFARRYIYVWPTEHGASVRLRTKGGRHSIRGLSPFSGDWHLDDWQKEIADHSYDVTGPATCPYPRRSYSSCRTTSIAKTYSRSPTDPDTTR